MSNIHDLHRCLLLLLVFSALCIVQRRFYFVLHLAAVHYHVATNTSSVNTTGCPPTVGYRSFSGMERLSEVLAPPSAEH